MEQKNGFKMKKHDIFALNATISYFVEQSVAINVERQSVLIELINKQHSIKQSGTPGM